MFQAAALTGAHNTVRSNQMAAAQQVALASLTQLVATGAINAEAWSVVAHQSNQGWSLTGVDPTTGGLHFSRPRGGIFPAKTCAIYPQAPNPTV